MISKNKLLCCAFLILVIYCSEATVIQIGTGTLLNVVLPVEPLAAYSYSQSIYRGSEIGFGGFISSLGWQYRINSTIFLPYTNQFSIYMGTVSRDRFVSTTDWIPLDSLQLVFQGELQPQWFSTNLPGNGWLTIPLNNIYNYSGTGNLVIAVDENMPGGSSMGDDFYCTAAGAPRSIQFHSMTINPNPAAPPAANTGNPLSHRPNLRIAILPVIYTPHSPVPANAAENVQLSPTLSWQSDAQSWDVLFAPANQPLMTAASNLIQPSWNPPMSLALLTNYHWQVVAHHGVNDYSGAVWTFTTMGETLSAPLNLQAMTVGTSVQLQWQAPAQGSIVMYRIIRNQQLLSECSETHFTDSNVLPNQTYWYSVEAVNHLNQISPPSNTVSVTIPGTLPVWQTNFEDQQDFSTELTGWTMHDMDNSPTWQFSGVNFPGEGNPMSWIVFNPSQTTPPLTSVSPHGGQKMLLCINGLHPPNNDWLISPPINVQDGYELSFWIRSLTADYGLERLRFLISTTNNQLSSFQPVSTEPWLSVPAAWTQLVYNLSNYAGQQIYLAWNCVSWDALALCLDDIRITQTVSNQDAQMPPAVEYRICPNPASDWFKVESVSKAPFNISIYNAKGQKIVCRNDVKTFEWQRNRDVDLSAGLYILKLESEHGITNHKIVIHK